MNVGCTVGDSLGISLGPVGCTVGETVSKSSHSHLPSFLGICNNCLVVSVGFPVIVSTVASHNILVLTDSHPFASIISKPYNVVPFSIKSANTPAT